MSDAKQRGSLWVRVSVLGIAIAIITGVLAGGLAIGLIRSSDDRDARRLLGKLANAAQTSVNHGQAIDQVAVKRRVLRAVRVGYGEIGPNLKVSSEYPLVRRALSVAERRQVLAGKSISGSRTVGGKRVYLEARPAGSGGVILVQRRSDATAGGEAAIRRTLLAIAIGIAIAAVLGVLVARRITRPLRTTAAAAHALAAGRRDVVVPLSGPAEVAEVADAVNTLAGALAQSEGRQREFLMSVSHDLRTPLTAITGYAESLAEGVVPPERTGEVGTVMLGEARRLERLVGDLLDLARLGAQDFRVEFAAVDLAGLAGAAAQAWSARCAAVGVTLTVEATAATAWTDATRLRQVLDGLMENALRVTPAGRPIVLAVRREADGRACAEVRDGGPGLTDDDLSVAFRRSALYERYRGVRQVGTGLGLAIVQGLVTRLGGTIEAGHASEGGARFTVRLPPGRP